MAKYALKRVGVGLVAVLLSTVAVMVMVYGLLDKNLIFADDPVFSRQRHNALEVYKMQQWENFSYVDYVPFGEYAPGVALGDTPAQDEAARETAERFTKEYEEKGYTVIRLKAVYRAGTKKYQEGGEPRLFAYREIPLGQRLLRFLTGLVQIDHLGRAEGIAEEDRELIFTLYDPLYGGRFAPAIMGNGTHHRYLLYFDGEFPYVHQNFIRLQLGRSYSVNTGVDVVQTLTEKQGSYDYRQVTYPTGLTEQSADDLHTAVYVRGSLERGGEGLKDRFDSDYTGVSTYKKGLSRLGYSFVIGILASFLSYLIAIPAATGMALRKDGLLDKAGTAFIVFIIAVPSLGYIFLFKAIGGALGLPVTFDMENPGLAQYVLPVVSLALPGAAGLMKWHRRYMVDGLRGEYVRFARSQGYSTWQILWKQVVKNAAIPIVHGIPGSVLGALVGAIITERVYVVPGAGNLLTRAINRYDNGVIVGMTAFYALLGVVSVVLGDLLMAKADPRIRLEEK